MFRHLTLDRLWLWLGVTIALLVYIPSTLYTTHHTRNMLETHLIRQGDLLGKAVGEQLIEPLLLSDQLTLSTKLHQAIHYNSAVRYVCVEDPQGRITAHTFGPNRPSGLDHLWRSSSDTVIRFNTAQESMIDIEIGRASCRVRL